MKHRSFSFLSMLLFGLLVAACAPQAATSSAEETQASLVNTLKAAGASVELGDMVEQPFFSIKPQVLKVNGADVQVFEYPTAEAMAADAAQVTPDGSGVGTSMVSWMATPHFFKDGRVIVLYVGDDAAVLDLLKNALGAQFAGR